MAVATILAACGASVDLTVDAQGDPAETPTADPDATPAAEPTEPEATSAPEPTSTEMPVAEPTPAASTPPPSTPTPAPTAAPTATEEPAPTPTPVPVQFVVAPDAPLLGIAIGSEASTTIEGLEALIGPPTNDTEWYVGCPLDGEELNERLLQWGDLNVYFELIGGEGIFVAWGYDVRIVDGGFPEPALVILPGGGRVGDPIDDVAAAAGLDVVYDETFDINRVGEPGYEIVSDGAPDAPVWGAFVPFVPACE